MNRDYLLSIAVVATVVFACGCPNHKTQEKSAAHQTLSPKITQFYASPGAVAPGEATLLCYGVESADELRMDPPLANVKPALSRCLPVTPKQTTTYTLTASNAAGQKSASVTMTVDRQARRAAPAAGEKPLRSASSPTGSR
jgi:hypothetical protein